VRVARIGALALGALALGALARPSGAAEAPGQVHPLLWPYAHSTGLVTAARERRIAALLARMSLAEKVGQLIQADIEGIQPADLERYPLGSIIVGGDPAPNGDVRAPPGDWLALMQSYQRIARAQRRGHTAIPLLLGLDAPHGIGHVRGATVFPQPIGLGAAHDAALVGAIGRATAEEAAALGFNWLFTPTLAIPQDLRWGRTYEAWSQDPALVRAYAGAAVRGLQGEVRGEGAADSIPRVAATAKHFLADGATEGGHDQGDAPVSERALIDTHVQGYLGAIDAGVMTIMVSYSSWHGVKMHGHRALLRQVLKGRLGFEGIVVGDWNGHNQLEGCSSGSCARAYDAGVDVLMAPDNWRELFSHTLQQVGAGEIAPARLEDAVRRVLRVKAALGLLDARPRAAVPPVVSPLEVLGSGAHRALARRAVRESLVLLKNDGHVLPIRAGAHVLVAGAGADDIGRQCGGWTLSWQGSGNRNVDFPQGQSIYAGIAAALASGGGSAELSPEGRSTRRPDVAIVVYGERPYAESLGDRATLDFDGADTGDLALLERLRAAQVPVVSVFLSGRPLWVESELAASDAFVAAWLPGTEGGGIADVLIGDAGGAARYVFSGTLSFRWPASTAAGGSDTLFPLGFGLRYGTAAGPGAAAGSGMSYSSKD
jgi:beta-glucosidase